MTDHTRAMLEEAWEAIHGGNPLWWNPADRFRFTRLLDAEAYLDAAVMLVPEGVWWVVSHVMGPQPMTRDLFRADVLVNKDLTIREHIAPTPALALLAAIMKAKNDE